MAFPVEDWLKEFGFEGDELKALATKFGAKSDVLEKNQLRQSDYSRSMNEVKKLQTKAEETNAALEREMAEFATLSAAEQAKAGDQRKRIEDLETKAFKYQQTLERVAEENGLDVAQVLEGVGHVEKPKPAATPEPFDPTPIRREVGAITSYLLALNGDLPAIAQEHLELTGNRLDTRAFVRELTDLANKGQAPDPNRFWEEKFDIGAKRQAKSQAEFEQKIATAREEGRRAGASEANLPGARPMEGTHSPVLRQAAAGANKAQRPQPGSRMQAAVNALREGKYRTPADWEHARNRR